MVASLFAFVIVWGFQMTALKGGLVSMDSAAVFLVHHPFKPLIERG
jgi:hypothetical protein